MTAVSGASIDDQKCAIERWAASWSARDVEGLLLICATDVVYEDVPMGVVNRGAAELRAFGEQVFSRLLDITFELQSSFSDGTKGGAEWIMRGTRGLPDLPQGKRVEIRGVSVFEFAGDKIQRCSDYWDMASYLKQLDLMPSA